MRNGHVSTCTEVPDTKSVASELKHLCTQSTYVFQSCLKRIISGAQWFHSQALLLVA